MGKATEGKTAMTPTIPNTWLPVQDAARVLNMNPEALRRALDRRVARASDGGIESVIDGVRGRKFGRCWRVRFTGGWLE